MGNNKYMQLFIVNYTINYPTGKKYTTSRECYGITEVGAIDTVKFLHSNYNVSIISVIPTGKKSNSPVYGCNYTLGER